MHILVACDSFKGSFTAGEACGIVAAAIRRMHPEWSVSICPLADGGEGTAEILLSKGRGRWIDVPEVMGPLPVMALTAGYGWLPKSATAIVEMARASGLALLADHQRLPLQTTTFGTGQLLDAAIRCGARHILLTLGGSATVDGGTGAARALGWRFLDASGRDVPYGGGGLASIARIVPPDRDLPPVTVLCDVTNPLCGPLGAARVFAPQKGAGPAEVARLEEGLRHLARLIEAQAGPAVADLAGGGAAGGFGAGAVAFLGGRLVPGISVVMEHLHFGDLLDRADWVITGEGCLDATSLQGKVISGVLEQAGRRKVPVAVLAGRVVFNPERLRTAGIRHAVAVAPADMPLAEALARAPELLDGAAQRMTSLLQSSD